jgi:hypothetical protein
LKVYHPRSLACAVLALPLVLAACDSAQVQQHRAARVAQRAIDALGQPDITHFREKRQLKRIYELQDAGVETITYIADASGHLHKVCDSVGYGMPVATSYARAQRASDDRPPIALPAPAPNGLYPPTTAAGTWIFCKPSSGGEEVPVLMGMAPIVSPFALSEAP